MFRMVLMSLAICFLYIGEISSWDTFRSLSFRRNKDFDNINFNQSFIIEHSFVASKLGCFGLCAENNECNLVLHNQRLNACRIYKDVFTSQTEGFVEEGWTYHGAACGNYRLPNGRPGTNVLDRTSKERCADTHQISCSFGGNCWSGIIWADIDITCVRYFNTPLLNLSPGKSYVTYLAFDLTTGMKTTYNVSGNLAKDNILKFRNAAFDVPLLYAVRWSRDKISFNTNHNTVFDEEIYVSPNPVQDHTAFTIEIIMQETHYQLLANGNLIMINPRRRSLDTARKLVMRGVTAIFSFEVDTAGIC